MSDDLLIARAAVDFLTVGCQAKDPTLSYLRASRDIEERHLLLLAALFYRSSHNKMGQCNSTAQEHNAVDPALANCKSHLYVKVTASNAFQAGLRQAAHNTCRRTLGKRSLGPHETFAFRVRQQQ